MPPPDHFGIAGKTVWITGAARGIGLATARLLAAHSARVVAVDRSLTPGITAVCAAAVELDVAEFAAVEDFAAAMAAKDLAPDVLVNNAGITRDAVIWKLSEAQWDDVQDTCLKGAFNLTRHAVPLMRSKATRAGAIINITSINGERGKFGQSNYAAAKAGLIGLTKSCARELGAFGIRVNAVAPGMVATDMADSLPAEIREKAVSESLLGRIASPDDVANAVLFLASPMAGHITGHVLRVDGGQYL